MTFLVFHNGLLAGNGSCAEDVERGAGDFPAFQRGDQRGLIDDAAARDVDEIGRRLHGGENLCADDAARFRRKRRQHDQKIEFAARS